MARDVTSEDDIAALVKATVDAPAGGTEADGGPGRGGAIVNVDSIAGMTGLWRNPANVASKHAVNGLTRNAAIDYAPYGIRVNSVNMSATDTPMVARAAQLVAASAAATEGPKMGRFKTDSILFYVDRNHRPVPGRLVTPPAGLRWRPS